MGPFVTTSTEIILEIICPTVDVIVITDIKIHAAVNYLPNSGCHCFHKYRDTAVNYVPNNECHCYHPIVGTIVITGTKIHSAVNYMY
jgi:hypothetical protein